MFHLLEKRIADAFASRVQSLYGISVPVQTEQPKQSSFGEIAVPAAFQLARQLKKAPKAIAAELAAGPIEGVSAIEIAGNGYLNIRFDRGYYAAGLLADVAQPPGSRIEKIIVEHTNINPNKAAHIGHLRNAMMFTRECPRIIRNTRKLSRGGTKRCTRLKRTWAPRQIWPISLRTPSWSLI